MSEEKPPRVSSRRLAESQNWRCAYCGIEMAIERDLDNSVTIDHVVSKSSGGQREWFNLVAACFLCNTHRRSMNAFKFYAIVSGRKKIKTGRGRWVYNGVLAYLQRRGKGPWAVSNIILEI